MQGEISLAALQSIPIKDLQGFCFLGTQVALSSYFNWQEENGRQENGNLVTLFLELTVVSWTMLGIGAVNAAIFPLENLSQCNILVTPKIIISKIYFNPQRV